LRLRNVEVSDIGDLFKWRNHTVIKKNFFYTKSISWEEHKRWLDTKIKDPNAQIYIAFCGGEKVGTVRFEDMDDTVKVSVMLNPDFLNKSLGSKIIGLAVKKFINEMKTSKPLIAEIKKDNIASIKAFQKAGFNESHLTFVYNTNKGSN
jgi:RimJ/RimL family protein N-acetyltransferase